jgi:hypothetical protein
VSIKLLSLKPLCLAALLCASAAAHAGITVYTSQSDFLAAVSAPGFDTYDDLSIAQYGLSLDRGAGAYGYTVSSPNGIWGAGVPGDHWLSNSTRTDAITFGNFSGGVSAFGGYFFGSDINGAYVPSGDLVLTAADGTTLTYSMTGTTRTSFLGFVSDSGLSSVTLLSSPAGNYWPTANDVVLAAVPEPATYGMFLAGLGFLGLMARRRT